MIINYCSVRICYVSSSVVRQGFYVCYSDDIFFYLFFLVIECMSSLSQYVSVNSGEFVRLSSISYVNIVDGFYVYVQIFQNFSQECFGVSNIFYQSFFVELIVEFEFSNQISFYFDSGSFSV